MRPFRPLLLACTLALSACQVTAVAPDPGKPVAPRATAVPKATPSPTASATPAAGPTAGTSPTAGTGPSAAPSVLAPAPPPKLQRPTGEVVALTGSVLVDARFAIAQGGGALLADDGQPLVAVAGGQVLSHNGSMVLSHNGSMVISHNGSLAVASGDGNVIVPAGAGLVAAGGLNGQSGGGLVAAGGLNGQGSGLVAAGGLNGQGGGGLVAAGGLNYGLLQATSTSPSTPAAAVPEPGAELPAAGMIVSVADLRTGKPVALGQDAAGKPVYEVYSNARGQYELFVPAALQGTVRVDARVPGTADPRLAYAVLVAPGSKQAAIDEDTALVTRFLTDSWRGRMAQLMGQLLQDPPLADDVILQGLYAGAGAETLAAVRTVLGPLIVELRPALRAAGLKDQAAIEKAAGRIAEAVLGHADLPGVRTKPSLAVGAAAGDVAEDPVLEVFKAVVALTRAKAAAQMKAAEAGGGEAAFLRSTYFKGAGPRIQRPVDVPAFIVAEALSNELDIQKLAAVPYFQALGLTKADAQRQFYRLYAANSAAAEHFAFLLVADADTKADVLAAIAAAPLPPAVAGP